ncbi:MAG TPA: hypothetical protein VK104_04925 [Burkholderiaceae bacterium]|nr:hypothetical protein [Burkholderiaceae bacterium]
MGHLTSLLQAMAALRDRWQFQPARADYYRYLADLLAHADGRFTLKDVFLRDAVRYGERRLRGRLSAFWLHAYQHGGGDLYTTWQRHFPHAELSLIRSAQALGNDAVIQTLRQFSRVLSLLGQARRLLTGVLWPALAAAGLSAALTLAIPQFTVPRLLRTFDSVPPEHYGRLTRRLVDFAQVIATTWPWVLLALMGITLLAGWSLTHLTGPLRRFLDPLLWWDSYRQLMVLQWASFLRIALGAQDQSATRLRQALLYQRPGARPWLRWHLDTMLQRIDEGVRGAAIFDTGMLGRPHYWFFSDMFEARGLNDALRLIAERVHQDVVGVMARRAQAFRWMLLLGCVAYLLGLALWHYAVIDELRRSLTLQFADF